MPPRPGRSLLNAPSVTLLLAARPWHRAGPSATVEHRWRMLCLAANSVAGLCASDQEVGRTGPSYTVDTLREVFDGQPLVWFIGGDAFAAVGSWHRVEDLPELCHFLVFDRPGAAIVTEGFRRGFRQVTTAAGLSEQPSGCVWFAPVADARCVGDASPPPNSGRRRPRRIANARRVGIY